MNVLVALDSFKGSVSSFEANEAVLQGVLEVDPAASVVKLAIADGGEGTVDALYHSLGGVMVTVKVRNPLMKFIDAKYLILNDQTAVIEMASAAGLTLLEEKEYNPLYTSTYGVGEMIHDAILRGCRRFIIGIGGSATNDAGIGMLQALGYKFLDQSGYERLGIGESLEHIVKIDDSYAVKELKDCQFQVACDVDNPMYGPLGAAHVFARQKGADDLMIKQLDRGLKQFCEVVLSQFNLDLKEVSGLGAAGGLGGAFYALLNTELKPGIELIFEQLHVEEHIKHADVIFTGEGRLDFQSQMGKVPAGVAKLANKHNKPVIAVAGQVTDDAYRLHDLGVTAMFSIMSGPMSLEEALDQDKTCHQIQKTVAEIMRLIRLS